MQQTVIFALSAMTASVALVLVVMLWRMLRRAVRSCHSRVLEWRPEGPQRP